MDQVVSPGGRHKLYSMFFPIQHHSQQLLLSTIKHNNKPFQSCCIKAIKFQFVY